jgi:hypothetical protein
MHRTTCGFVGVIERWLHAGDNPYAHVQRR